MDTYSEQGGVEADRRLAMSELRRRFGVLRRRRRGRRLAKCFVVVVFVQVVSRSSLVVASTPHRLHFQRQRRRRQRHAAESVDTRSTGHRRRSLPRRPARRCRTCLVLRRCQSLAPRQQSLQIQAVFRRSGGRRVAFDPFLQRKH